MAQGAQDPLQDHPRACGEHHYVDSFTNISVRITPAPAGSTCACRNSDRYVEDHPRACGEHETLRVAGVS